MEISFFQIAALALLALGVLALIGRPLPPGPAGPPGPKGERGEPGPQGPRGERGTVHVVAEPGDPTAAAGKRFEMYRDGAPTGHWVIEGSADYQEAFRCPGLSLVSPDGTVIEGAQ